MLVLDHIRCELIGKKVSGKPDKSHTNSLCNQELTLCKPKKSGVFVVPGLVGSLPLEEQQLWFPNQQVHDPDSWTVPGLGCENRPVNMPVSMETGLERPCCPASDLLWVQITQSYPNRLKFSRLPCPQSLCHTVIDPVFKEGFFLR